MLTSELESLCTSNTLVSGKDAVVEALNSFSHAVSTSISVLTERLGYSSTRAADSILNTLTESNYTLNDEKVFTVMRRYGLSFEDASKIVTTGECFRITMSKWNLSPIDAIHHLTSKLVVEQLMNNIIEKSKSQEQKKAQPSQLTDFVQSLSSFKTTEVHITNHNSNNRPPSMKSIKTKTQTPRMDLPPKAYGNEIKQDSELANGEDEDAKLAAKALTMTEPVSTAADQNTHKVKAPSPASSSVRSKRICNRDGNDNPNQQPPLKRPRTESV